MERNNIIRLSHPEYLHFKTSGQINLSNIVDTTKFILEAVKTSNQQKILIETNEQNSLSVADTYTIIIRIKELAGNFIYKIKIAFLDHQEKNPDYIRFAENVAVNRGFKLKIFQSKSEAEKWLLD